MLKSEFKRIMLNPINILFFIVVPIAWYLGASNMLHNYDFLKNAAASNQIFYQRYQLFSGYTVFADGISSFYLSIITVLLSGLSFSSSFIYDKNTGFGNYTITRTNIKKYFYVKTITTFVAPFIYIFIALLVILFFCLVKFSANNPQYTLEFIMNPNSELVKLFVSYPFLSCCSMIATISFFSSIYTLIGMAFSSFTNNRFLVSIAPFSMYILCTLIPQLFPLNSNISKLLAWVFPTYFTGIFTNTDIWYSNLSDVYIYIIHFMVYLIIAILLLIVLFYKNNKQYIK